MNKNHYIEYFGDDCCFCGGKIYTISLDEDVGECINCKARFTQEDSIKAEG